MSHTINTYNVQPSNINHHTDVFVYSWPGGLPNCQFLLGGKHPIYMGQNVGVAYIFDA